MTYIGIGILVLCPLFFLVIAVEISSDEFLRWTSGSERENAMLISCCGKDRG